MTEIPLHTPKRGSDLEVALSDLQVIRLVCVIVVRETEVVKSLGVELQEYELKPIASPLQLFPSLLFNSLLIHLSVLL